MAFHDLDLPSRITIWLYIEVDGLSWLSTCLLKLRTSVRKCIWLVSPIICYQLAFPESNLLRNLRSEGKLGEGVVCTCHHETALINEHVDVSCSQLDGIICSTCCHRDVSISLSET